MIAAPICLTPSIVILFNVQAFLYCHVIS